MNKIMIAFVVAMTACAVEAPQPVESQTGKGLCIPEDPDCGPSGSNPNAIVRAGNAVVAYSGHDGITCGGTATDAWCIIQYENVIYQCTSKTDGIWYCDANHNCHQVYDTRCWTTISE